MKKSKSKSCLKTPKSRPSKFYLALKKGLEQYAAYRRGELILRTEIVEVPTQPKTRKRLK